MKKKSITVTTAILIVLGILSMTICAWQTAYLMQLQNLFAAEHPTYVSHSWMLLILFAAVTVLACGQAVLSYRRGLEPESPGLCCSMSILMIVLEVLALRFAAAQHYHLGMLVSDYGVQAPFTGGWLLLMLAVALLVASISQLLIVFLSTLSRTQETA